MKKILVFTVLGLLLTACTNSSSQKREEKYTIETQKNTEVHTESITPQIKIETGVSLETGTDIEQKCLVYSGGISQIDSSGNPNGLSLNLPEFSGQNSHRETCRVASGSITIIPNDTCTGEVNSDCSGGPTLKYVQCEKDEVNDGFGECIKNMVQ